MIKDEATLRAVQRARNGGKLPEKKMKVLKNVRDTASDTRQVIANELYRAKSKAPAGGAKRTNVTK